MEKDAPFGLDKGSGAGFQLPPSHSGVTLRECSSCKNESAALCLGQGSCDVPVHTHTLSLSMLSSLAQIPMVPKPPLNLKESNEQHRRELNSMYEKPKSKQYF